MSDSEEYSNDEDEEVEDTNIITVLDSNKAQLSGASTFNVGTLYWIFGTSNSNFPFSGSIFTQMIYNRKLTDNEILQNYQYFKYRLGLI